MEPTRPKLCHKRAPLTTALRLGTRDAMLHYHAGMIAYALEGLPLARHHLQQALTINPNFSIRYALQARALLAELNIEDGR
jgi:lipoprotein NlpI